MSESYKDTGLKHGTLRVKTTSAFKMKEPENLVEAVYMDGKATFVMDGKPNGDYVFPMEPTFYIAETDHNESTIISSDLISSTKAIHFGADGNACCVLDEN